MLFYADFQALYSLDGKPYPGQAKKTSYYHQDCPGRPEHGVRDVDREPFSDLAVNNQYAA